MKKSLIAFGEYIEGKSFPVLDERAIRASAGINFLFGLVAFINGFLLENYIVIPFISGFLLFNFLIGVLINPRFAPTFFLGSIIVSKQDPLYVGAIQKKFAWSLGALLVGTVFILSFFLLQNGIFFGPICMLCLICLVLIFFESAFGICIGCKIYFLAIKWGLIKEPKSEEKPNCIGNSCEVKDN